MKAFFRPGIVILLSCILLTGCSRSPIPELGNVNVVTGFFAEYFPEEQSYRLSLEIADFSGYEKSSDITAKRITAKGKTIAYAFEKINQISEKQLYISHAKVILLGRGFQALNLKNTIDFFLNHPEINSDIQICMTQTDILSEQEDSDSSFFAPLSSLLKRETLCGFPSLYQLYQKENQSFSLPVVSLNDATPAISSSAVFSNYQYQRTVQNDIS
ncbi:MAG: hypothetical protein J6A61_00975 [Clostridia bacterium]|nr:hypothetical protein [Clostridia bacterium]